MNSVLSIPEHHPLKPFLPAGATILMLGSFPPPREKWSMDFFYPNFQNDMWRIIGLLYYNDPAYFIAGKRFDAQKVITFCQDKEIALYDTARTVIRQRNNASDKYLEVVERTDIPELLERLPECRRIVVTGQKAIETLLESLSSSGLEVSEPVIGEFSGFIFAGREIHLYRMPSTSRAYPLSIVEKAKIYQRVFG